MVETIPDTQTRNDNARVSDGSLAAASFNRALLESMPDGVVACDADGALTLFNRAAREWHGADPLRLPPTEWAKHYNLYRSDGVTPLPADEIPLARAFRGEPVANEEMAIAVPGHPVRFVVASGTKITDPSGTSLGAVVVMHDVTELRRVEAELRRANQELESRVAQRTDQLARQHDTSRGILDSAAAPIFSVDRDYRYTAFNRHHAEVMRSLYGAEIEVGKCLLDYMTRAEDRTAARRNLDRALAGETLTAEAPSGADSCRRYFRVGHSPIRCDSGEIIGVAVLAHDITDRRQAEEKLQKSEQQYRDIFDNVFDGISLVEVLEDGRFRIVEANPALERLAGVPRSLMVGRTHAEVFADETARMINETYGRCVERACPTEEDVLLDLPAGRRHLQVLLAPTVGPDGRVTRVVSIWRDVTERRRAEAERRANLRFFEGMDRVNRAIQGSADITQMMSDVLDVVLELLECDRAYLVYPCNPDAATWTVPMERTRATHSGVLALNLELPVDRAVAETFRILLAESGPVQFGPGTAHRLPEDVSKRFGFKCFMAMAVYPKGGEPWQFGVHQCSHARLWTPEEERLVREIGRRIADALTSLLTSRSLQESEAKYRQIVDTAAEGIWMLRSDTHASYANAQMASMLGYEVNELLARPVTDFMPEEDQADHRRRMQNRHRGLSEAYERRFLRRDGSILWTHVSATPVLDDRGRFKGAVAMFTDITQRKRTEEELRQSTELTRAIIDAAPAAIIGLDLDGRVCLVWNRAAEELLGWRADEAMGKFLPSVPTEKREEFARFRAQIRDGLTLNGVEVHRQRRDGSPIDYSIYASPLRGAEHEIIGNVAVLVDITERRRADEALRRLNRELQAVSACNQTLLRATDERSLVADVCAIICRDAGYQMAWVGVTQPDAGTRLLPLAFVAGRDSSESRQTPPNLDPEEDPTVAAVCRGETLVVQDLSLSSKPAAWCQIAREHDCRSGIWLPLNGEDGAMLGVALICSVERDAFTPDEISLLEELAADLGFGISVLRARAQQRAAERSVALLNFALNTVGEAVFLINERATFEYVNDGACRALGYTREELLGRSLQDVDPSFPAARWHDHWRRLKEKRSLVIESHHVNRNGRAFPVDISANYFEYEGRGYNLVIARDISERRRLEDHLRQTQKMDAIGTLAGGIAHDFNNILTGIIGYGELLEVELPSDSPVRESVRHMLATSERGAQLTSRLLAFSRKQVVDPKPVDLNEIVRNVDKFLRRLIGEDIELSVTLVSKDLIIMADSGQVEQVLVNLAANARDAMRGGGRLAIVTKLVQIDGELGRDDAGTGTGAHAMISVTDSGVGMDKQTLERMFDPFFTTKEVGKGTGLGLAIVYGIVKQHGGVVDVSSELGKGTSLKLFFPVVAQSVKRTEARSLAPPASGTETVLLAEDDATVRGATATFLRNFGYHVIEANDGQEALEQFAARGPEIDILLLDVIMPKKSGREVHDFVIKQRRDLPVLFMSGYTADVVDRQGLLGGGLQLLSKPFSPFELLRRIRALLDAEE